VEEARKGLQINSGPIIMGAALAAVGGLVGFAGLALGASALVTAARRWVDELDQPPTEVAKATWQQLRAAGAAGAEAWKSPSDARRVG